MNFSSVPFPSVCKAHTISNLLTCAGPNQVHFRKHKEGQADFENLRKGNIIGVSKSNSKDICLALNLSLSVS